ncbi:MAG TPA: sugar ABC transporter substrate-binding protein [Thermomicrobiales bacterium]
MRPVQHSWLRYIAWLLLVTTSLATSAVQAQEATPSPAAIPDPQARDFGPVAARSPYRLALLIPFPDDPFWQAVRSAVVERAERDGVTVDVLELAAPSVPEQVAQIESAVRAEYDGILLGPIDELGAVPGIEAANAAGVPVIAIDVAPAGGEVVSVVQTDDFAAARLAGDFIAEEIGGEGQVLNLQGDLSSVVGQERDRGFREALSDIPEISVISVTANWDETEAFLEVRGRLPDPGTPVPDDELLSAVFAANAPMALGAAQAVDEAEADEVVVVGFGLTTETLTAIQRGRLTATVAEFPRRAGAIAVDLMVRHLNGEAVPSAVDSGAVIATRENLSSIPR